MHAHLLSSSCSAEKTTFSLPGLFYLPSINVNISRACNSYQEEFVAHLIAGCPHKKEFLS